MRFLLFLISLIFLTILAYGQHTIKGVVLSQKQKGEPGIGVTLRKINQNRIVGSANTDSLGFFKIEDITDSDYYLTFFKNKLQIKEVAIKVFGKTDSALVVKIYLDDTTRFLKEVTIQAKRPLFEQQPGKLVFNVKESPIAANGTVLDALERAPGVDLDKSKFSLSLNGKNGVAIMINGKLSYQPVEVVLRMLSGMEARNLQKIELMSNPTAEFDAAGNAGIINIILVKNKNQGLSGNYGLSVGYGKKEKTGANFDINYGQKRLNMSSSVSYYRDHTQQVFTNERNVILSGDDVNRFITNNRNPVSSNFSGRVDINYMLDTTLTIGGFFTTFRNSWDMTSKNDTKVNVNQTLQSRIDIDNSEKNILKNFSGNFFINKKTVHKEELNLDLDFLYYGNDDRTKYLNSYLNLKNEIISQESINLDKITPVKIGAVKFDYRKSFSGATLWKSGIKSTLTNLSNDIRAYSLNNNNILLDTNLSSLSKYNESISAIYSELTFDITKKTHVNAGLRYEYSYTILKDSQTELDFGKRSGNLFPSFFVSQTINDQHSFQLSFSRRINRPSYNDLAPFIVFLDPTTYFFGNPNLNASKSYTYKFDYVFNKYLLTFQYNYAKDAINPYQATLNDQNDRQIFTAINLKYAKSISVMLSIPVTLTKRWNLQTNILGMRQSTQSAQLTNNVGLSQYYFKINHSQSFSFSQTLSANISGWYQSKKLGGLSYMAPRGKVDFAVQRKINNDIIRISYSDIFASNNEKDYTNIPSNNLNIKEIYRFESRIFKLSYIHNFGSSKVKIKNRESTVEDIKSRVN